MKPSIYNRKEIYLNCILERGFEDTCVFSLYVHVHRELLRGLLKDSTSSYNTLHKRLKNTVHSIQAVVGVFHCSVNKCVGVSIYLALFKNLDNNNNKMNNNNDYRNLNNYVSVVTGFGNESILC